MTQGKKGIVVFLLAAVILVSILKIVAESSGKIYGWKVKEMSQKVKRIRMGDPSEVVLKVCGKPKRTFQRDDGKIQVWVYTDFFASSQTDTVEIDSVTGNVVGKTLSE